MLPGQPALHVDVISLFPSIFQSWLEQGVVSRARERGIVRIDFTDLRQFGIGKHRITDDYPFGGGAGMVLKPEPLFSAIESLQLAADIPIVLLSPQGTRFDQQVAARLSMVPRLALVAGHYEGIDERVRRHAVTEELSIGDYVLSSGELAIMVVVDAVVRLLPGALAEGSAAEESFAGGLLEYPQYTRPADFRGMKVPDILLSGHQSGIARWRRREALRRTVERRPDLVHNATLSEEERAMVERWATLPDEP